MTCVLLDHPKPRHDYQPIGVVAKQHKETLKTTSAILQKKSNEGQNALHKIKHASQKLQGNTKKAKDVILQREKEILEEFTKKLKSNTAVLLEEVDKKHNEVNGKLVKQHDDMKAYVEKVNGSLEFAKNIIEKGSSEEVLTLRNEIEANAINIEKEKPEMILPVHYGEIKYHAVQTTKELLDAIKLDGLGEIDCSPFRKPGAGDFRRSNVSFLFSLRNKDNLPPFKCPVKDNRNGLAIWCYPSCGATFGGDLYAGRDLLISHNANANQYSYCNLGLTYQPPLGYQWGTPETKALLAGSENFQPMEIEVFCG